MNPALDLAGNKVSLPQEDPEQILIKMHAATADS